MNLMNEEKHYNTLTNYYKHKYGKKVAKVSLNAGFTCPNKDGKKGLGGCTYCSKLGAGDFAGNVKDSLKVQFENIKKIMNNKWEDTLYIPYLQANTNTYGSVEKLKKVYDELMSLDPNVCEIAIATRADCLEDEKIELLAKYNKQIPIQIELGLQTSNETTANLINRNCSNEEFVNAVNKLRSKGIDVVVHIMNGLPGETKEDMLNTIDFLNNLDIQGVKIHSLCVLKNTKMGDDYLKEPFKILTLEEYVDIVVAQIAKLNPDIIIHRLSADFASDDLIAPLWTRKKMIVMNEIDKKLRSLSIYQGDHFKKGQLS